MVLKLFMCASVIFLAIAIAIVGESHFDQRKKNNAPVWLLSIPLAIFLICQSSLAGPQVLEEILGFFWIFEGKQRQDIDPTFLQSCNVVSVSTTL